MPPRKFTMKKKNGKKLKGGFDWTFGFGKKPSEPPAPALTSAPAPTSSNTPAGQPPTDKLPTDKSPTDKSPTIPSLVGGKKRRSQKKSKTQKKKR